MNSHVITQGIRFSFFPMALIILTVCQLFKKRSEWLPQKVPEKVKKIKFAHRDY